MSTNGHASVALGKLLAPVKREVSVAPHKEYELLGARWYAKGLYTKEIKPGARIKASKLYRVEAGDFVYNRLFAWKGSFAVASRENHDCFVSNEFPCFDVDEQSLDSSYLWYFFQREAAWTTALGLSYGATPTSRNRLKESNLLSMAIPLPPLSEQRRIVAKIERLAAKIDEAQRAVETASESTNVLVPSARARVFEELLRSSRHPVTRFVEFERGKFTHRPRNDPRFFGGDHPWIQIAEIEASGKHITAWSETLNDEGLRISKKFTRGTVLISIAATIGAVGILDFDCCVPDSIVAAIPKEGTDSEFVYHYLRFLRTHLETIAPQSAQKNINLAILTTLPFPQTPLPEQRRIVANLDGLQAKVDQVKRLQAESAAELDALLPAILDRAFKGQL
jgi:type I restriction enzyme, S subunit